MHKALKIRLYPSSAQAAFLNAQFGAVRFVYNKGLHLIRRQYQRCGQSLSATKDIKPLLSVAKRSRKYSWLKSYDSIALQQACIHLGKAFSNFFNVNLSARYPCFKSKHGKQSSYHCMGISCGENWIKIPKLSRIKAKVHRAISGKLKSITVTRSQTGKYFASLLFEDGVDYPEPNKALSEAQILGLDLGLTHLLIDSNGQKTPNPRFLKRATQNLRRKQKSLSRKQKGSASRSKARLLLAKCHEKLRQSRQDFQHKVSKQLIDENQAIVVETLKVKNMLKNKKLARHIADAAWDSLLAKLAYKAQASGKYLVKIDQWFASSKTCCRCHQKVDSLPLSVRLWECPHCGAAHDRDINAARNIRQQGILKLKAEGLSVSANGGLRETDTVSAVA